LCGYSVPLALPGRPSAALAALAPLALAPLALLAVLTLAPPALRLSLRCHVGKLEERIVDKGISSSAEALLSLSSTPSSSVWLARGYTQ